MNGIQAGIDIFDCVLPTRNARNGTLFTSSGKLVIKNSQFTRDRHPIDERCSCFTCQNYSRAYIRHLYMAGEMLAARLNTIHNLHYYMDLMSEMRMAILEDRFIEFKRGFLKDRAATV
jgi:queuine tRNA-ribosyltransferase